jgi:hypothetical protein
MQEFDKLAHGAALTPADADFAREQHEDLANEVKDWAKGVDKFLLSLVEEQSISTPAEEDDEQAAGLDKNAEAPEWAKDAVKKGPSTTTPGEKVAEQRKKELKPHSPKELEEAILWLGRIAQLPKEQRQEAILKEMENRKGNKTCT